MGESQLTLFQPKLNRSIRLETRAERLSGDAGALPLRDLADRLGYRALFTLTKRRLGPAHVLGQSSGPLNLPW